jgi:glutaredoxin
MDVMILATKDCSHRPILERKLNEMNVEYEMKFVEDNPGEMKKYQIRNSPNLIVNSNIVFRASPIASLPSDGELKSFLHK